MHRIFLLAFVLTLMFTTARGAETPDVVVSIKPLHSLVQAVMGETGTAGLLVKGSASPHGFALKPSQIRMIQSAKVIFFLDLNFEVFLEHALASASGVDAISLADDTDLTLLENRKGGAWEAHEELGGPELSGSQDHDHHENINFHVWLDTKNAREIVRYVAQQLSLRFPENSASFRKNAAAVAVQLDNLENDLREKLGPLKSRPFIVLHDAYAYFEAQNGLNGVGSITLKPNEPPSANRLQQIRARLSETNAVCVYREPQFDDRLVRTVIEGSPAKQGVMDPLGSTLEPGPGLYFDMMSLLADDFAACMRD